MRWFRSHTKPWGWVALLALALQLGLSFGHVHGAHADRPAAVLAATADAGNASATDTGDSSDADYCATCAILALLTGAQTASAPVFVLPIALASAEIIFVPEAARLGSLRAAFRSRAPPLS